MSELSSNLGGNLGSSSDLSEQSLERPAGSFELCAAMAARKPGTTINAHW